MRPHRWQPTRLPHPWDSPGKNTGVVCHFLLQCVKVKSESEVAESCLALSKALIYFVGNISGVQENFLRADSVWRQLYERKEQDLRQDL